MFWRCSPLYFFSERKVNWATFSWGTSFATKIIFVFDHINYYHFLPVQYVSWEYLQMSKPDVIFKPDVWLDFMQNAFVGSVGGEQFSIILWDLITETTINREVKVTGGPLHGSRNNSRIILPFFRSSRLTFQIRSPNWRKHCRWTVGEGPLKELIKDQIKAASETKISLFNTIPLEDIITGLKKEKKQEKKIDMLKDCQGFGLLVSKVKALEEAFRDLLTTIPLAMASKFPKGHYITTW